MKVNQLVKNIWKIVWRITAIVLYFWMSVCCFTFQTNIPIVALLIDIVGVIAFFCVLILFVNLLTVIISFFSDDWVKQDLIAAATLFFLGVVIVYDKGYLAGTVIIIASVCFFLYTCSNISLQNNYPDQG